jgi:hypothetical protein
VPGYRIIPCANTAFTVPRYRVSARSTVPEYRNEAQKACEVKSLVSGK